jgi:hypothetical protein
MKFSAFACLVLLCSAGSAANSSNGNTTVFSNIDDSTAGWGQCTGAGCAGGSSASNYFMAQNQTTPSKDGASTEFYVDGAAYTDVLFWNKLGAHDSLTHFTFDFWSQFDANSSTIGQAFEFDTFQFTKGREYMFGTQCDYAAGVWEVWNAGAGAWQKTSVACPKFTPNVWYHITWNVHRNVAKGDKNMYYDSFTVAQYDTTGTTVVSNNTYTLNLVYPSTTMPTGWTDNMGVQFQIDLNGQSGVNGNPSSTKEWVDRVSLTAW